MIASAGKDETALRRLTHRITERLARATFHPIATANDGGIAIAYPSSSKAAFAASS